MGSVDFNHCVEQVFQEACFDLLGSLGCSVAFAEQNDGSLYDAPVACIDAGSKEVELVLGLQMPISLLACTHPANSSSIAVGEEHLEDWISELSNQLIGRVKSKLNSNESDLKLGVPVTYYGDDESELMQQDEKIALYFELDGEVCACYLSIELLIKAEDVICSDYFQQNVEDSERGELELF